MHLIVSLPALRLCRQRKIHHLHRKSWTAFCIKETQLKVNFSCFSFDSISKGWNTCGVFRVHVAHPVLHLIHRKFINITCGWSGFLTILACFHPLRVVGYPFSSSLQSESHAYLVLHHCFESIFLFCLCAVKLYPCSYCLNLLWCLRCWRCFCHFRVSF